MEKLLRRWSEHAKKGDQGVIYESNYKRHSAVGWKEVRFSHEEERVIRDQPFAQIGVLGNRDCCMPFPWRRKNFWKKEGHTKMSEWHFGRLRKMNFLQKADTIVGDQRMNKMEGLHEYLIWHFENVLKTNHICSPFRSKKNMLKAHKKCDSRKCNVLLRPNVREEMVWVRRTSTTLPKRPLPRWPTNSKSLGVSLAGLWQEKAET